MGFLHDCTYHFGTRYCSNDKRDKCDDDMLRFRYHPMYYRFHRYIPRRRMWRAW